MTDTDISRRVFLGGALAAIGGTALPFDLFATDGKPLVKLGVLSDIHIGGRKEAPKYLENALRWLDARGVEAILSPGDIAHSGRIYQMLEFAKVWHRVFPGNRNKAGRKIDLMISTGNHDAWEYKGDKYTDEWRTKELLTYKDNPVRFWDEQFGMKWDLVWRNEVNGVTFIGSQWPSLGPDLEGFMKTHGKEFDPNLPFFHCQHEHPLGTCHGSYGCGYDKGQTVRAFANSPNAVVFSGHSHCSVVDERAVWQGAFTSIGAGCVHEGGLAFTHDNCSAFWHPSHKKNIMKPLNDAANWGGDCEGGCFLFVEVYADRLVVHRRSSVWDLPMGPDWIVPIPAKGQGPFDFKIHAAKRSAPQFAPEAAVTVQVCPQGHDLEGVGHRNEPCVYVTFPAARPVDGCRVFDYVVTAKAAGKAVSTKMLFAAGGLLPPDKFDRPTECLFSLKELPAGKDVTFEIVPRECFGAAGRALASAPLTLPA